MFRVSVGSSSNPCATGSEKGRMGGMRRARSLLTYCGVPCTLGKSGLERGERQIGSSNDHRDHRQHRIRRATSRP